MRAATAGGPARRSALGQSQLALADDIALNLAGPPRDRVLARAEHPVEPSRRVRHVAGWIAQERMLAQQLARKARDRDSQFRTCELHHRSFRSRRQAL